MEPTESDPERGDTPPAADSPEPAPAGGDPADVIERLVERAQAGDAEALNDLFARYHQTMVEVARRKLGPRLRLKEDPDDLAQTTFREATRDFARYQYQGQASLLKWLVQILQNKIRDKAEFYSAGKRDVSREHSTDETTSGFDLTSHDLSVTQTVQRGEDYELLREALEDLSPEHRQAITLVFFQGLSLRDAGERMGGKTEDAVRMMLRRAESKLGAKLRASLGE